MRDELDLVPGLAADALAVALKRRAGLSSSALERAGAVRKGRLTFAGAVALGADPSAHPALQVEVLRFPSGLAESAKHDLAPQIRPSAGPTVLSIEVLAAELADHLAQADEVLHRARLLALELLVNAVGHRDFATPHEGAPVRVVQYSDQVRIVSPGLPVEPVRIAGGRLEGRMSRNPCLMDLLRRLVLARQQGIGVPRAQNEARELGWSLVWEVRDSCVHAILSPDVDAQAARRGQARSTEQRTGLTSADRQELILDLLEKSGPLPAKAIRERLNLAQSTVHKDLRELADSGRIAPLDDAPRSPMQRYEFLSRHPTRR